MSISEPAVLKLVTRKLEKEFCQKYDLSISETPYIDKLLTLAATEPFDLFILILNNMRYSDTQFCEEKGVNVVDARLELITYLHRTYHKPVIAMTGWTPTEDSWTEENTKQAGASFFFLIPVEGRPLMNAVKQCLEAP